jgi:DNA-binding GntR family transcriptional regulator
MSELILNGDIKPGQLITIQALSDSFGVSAMPIREALQRLVSAGVLSVISGRSIGVPPLTLNRLNDLTRVRIEVEGTASRWASQNISKASLKELEKLFNDTRQAVEHGDLKSFLYSNRIFHFTLYRLSKSEILLDIIEKLWLQATPYFHHLYRLDKYETANRQHRSILESLKKGDHEGVVQGVRADIETGYKILVKMLEEDGHPE